MSKLLQEIKEAGEDFEWYPTTQEMIDAIKYDINQFTEDHLARYELNIDSFPSMLDCGAGDGRVLQGLARGHEELFAIEKSKPLLSSYPNNIFVIGTAFEETTLLDKKVDIVFSNPPYSEFVYWAEKIIKEARASLIYLIIPERWRENDDILTAIELRDAVSEILGTYSFDGPGAERKSRAKVDIVRIKLHRRGQTSDPFGLWFDENLRPQVKEKADQTAELKKCVSGGLASGRNLIEILEQLYNAEMAALMRNYKAIANLDPDLLEELDVNVRGISTSLAKKISGLKAMYWSELFNNYEPIYNRLTKRVRERLLSKLHENVSVEFNRDNVYAVTMWVIKNCNQYIEEQIIDVFESLVEKANITAYKSNETLFKHENWRRSVYLRPSELERYRLLEKRLVITRSGGIADSEWSLGSCNGLSERAADFIKDLIAVAHSFGFITDDEVHHFQWESGATNEFKMSDDSVLMSVKAFNNGNLHIKFNIHFITRLNVEFGRLKGWLKSSEEAVEELKLSDAQSQFIQAFFDNPRLHLGLNNFVKMLEGKVEHSSVTGEIK